MRSATPIMHGTEDAGLFRSERYGNFSYSIPVPPGKYLLRLYFAETYFGQGNPGVRDNRMRSFDVYCNGVALLRNFDPLSEAGPNSAAIKIFHGVVPTASGKLDLTFVPVSNLAMINAIEVLQEP